MAHLLLVRQFFCFFEEEDMKYCRRSGVCIFVARTWCGLARHEKIFHFVTFTFGLILMKFSKPFIRWHLETFT